MSQLDAQSVGHGPSPQSGSHADGDEDDELSDAALDAVVGGLSVEAALQHAAAFNVAHLG